MSLTVYLSGDSASRNKSRIFIREGGTTKEITEEEWNVSHPGEPPITLDGYYDDELYSANITHNLNKMADAAGIYKALWRPEEIGVTKAIQLIIPLSQGLVVLLGDRPRFEEFNPPNGWGSYDALITFVKGYLSACVEYPDSEVSVSR
jgi:hypothetical protein